MNEITYDEKEESDDNFMANSYNREAARIDHYKEIAFDKGYKEGEAHGIKRGKAEEKVEIAKKLYDSDVNMKVITPATGVTDKQMKKICLSAKVIEELIDSL